MFIKKNYFVSFLVIKRPPCLTSSLPLSLLLQASEVNHLIASQPTARKAVRLQALLPVKPEDRTRGDIMDKLSVGMARQ